MIYFNIYIPSNATSRSINLNKVYVKAFLLSEEEGNISQLLPSDFPLYFILLEEVYLVWEGDCDRGTIVLYKELNPS